jgi:protein FAM50
MKKDPTIDTSFLPDREREEVLAKERMRLKKEWFELQDRMKEQLIHVTYMYWEAPGMRKVEACRQGDAVGKFLAAIRRHFPVIKNTNPDDLMLVKEGIIIPLHYTFYDFVINHTKGKHGLLFDADAPAALDTDTPDGQICKVVDRTWYEKNRHIYPASLWELFDPQKEYGNVRVSGKDKLYDFF